MQSVKYCNKNIEASNGMVPENIFDLSMRQFYLCLAGYQFINMSAPFHK